VRVDFNLEKSNASEFLIKKSQMHAKLEPNFVISQLLDKKLQYGLILNQKMLTNSILV
jgi:hypothetical protein